MSNPSTHYHRIETAEELATEQEDQVMYYLARIEGQLVRIEYWNEHGGSGIELGTILISAKDYLSNLRRAIENRPDAS